MILVVVDGKRVALTPSEGCVIARRVLEAHGAVIDDSPDSSRSVARRLMGPAPEPVPMERMEIDDHNPDAWHEEMGKAILYQQQLEELEYALETERERHKTFVLRAPERFPDIDVSNIRTDLTDRGPVQRRKKGRNARW